MNKKEQEALDELSKFRRARNKDKNIEEFKWTDDLVSDFANWYNGVQGTDYYWSQYLLPEWKQSYLDRLEKKYTEKDLLDAEEKVFNDLVNFNCPIGRHSFSDYKNNKNKKNEYIDTMPEEIRDSIKRGMI